MQAQPLRVARRAPPPQPADEAVQTTGADQPREENVRLNVRTVRIKRQRDEPSLPTFVLGGSASKRPALAQLSLDTPAVGSSEASGQDAPKPQGKVRFRLVRTTGAGGFAARDERLQRGQRLQGRHQAAARFQRVATHRLDDDPDGAELELHRCAPAAPAKPKLVPFGPPLPPSRPAARWADAGEAEDSRDEMADIWRDAASAASLESQPVAAEGPEAAEGDSGDFVYDIYEVETEAGTAGEEGRAPAEDEEVWYEELDAATLLGLEEMLSEHGSGSSEGEQDYPDEESSECDSAEGIDSDDEDDGPGNRWNRGGDGAKSHQAGGSTDYLNMVW
tara:strand:+ start:105 stop:1106 length:1002 start_codon:yes stop_codon:yes gene_type:complete